MTYNPRKRSVTESKGNRLPMMNKIRMEVLRLGCEVVDLLAIPEPIFNEAEDITSL